MTSNVAALQMQVDTLQSRVDKWDEKMGQLVALSSQSRHDSRESANRSDAAREAAEKAVDEVISLKGAILELQKAMSQQCNIRHRTVDDRLEELEDRAEETQPVGFTPYDPLESTTDVMDRDELVSSRQNLKTEIQTLRKQLGRLQEAERQRAQAERDIQIEKAARQQAEKDFQTEMEARKADQMVLESERRKRKITIVVAVLSLMGTIGAAIITSMH